MLTFTQKATTSASSDLRITSEDMALIDLVQRHLMDQGVSAPDWHDIALTSRQQFSDQIRRILLKEVSFDRVDGTTQRVADALIGIGLLQRFIREPGVEEIYVRGQEVAVERNGQLERLGPCAPESYWENLIRRVADLSGHAISPVRPAVLVDLPGGERFTGMLPPLMDAPAINIRCFGRRQFTLDSLAEAGTFEAQPSMLMGGLEDIRDRTLREKAACLPDIGQLLAWVVAAQTGNILIAGEFSSGKTTLLNALSEYIPADRSVAVLETFRELQLADHLYQMRAIAPSEAQPGQEGGATMEWVLNVIYTRANPAAIILGEIVSPGEAIQFLKGASLGRKAYATIHGGSVQSALARLETLALGAQPALGLRAMREMVASGVNWIVFLQRTRLCTGRMVRHVADLCRIDGIHSNGSYRLTPVRNLAEASQ